MRISRRIMTEKKLTLKQAQFVAEYLVDLNAKQASIRCGYSPRSAEVQGSRLLSDANVKAAIEIARAERNAAVKVDAAYVLKRLFDMAEADRSELYDDGGNLLPVKEWPEVWRKGMVAGIKTHELFEGYGEDRKLVGYSKEVKTIDLLGILQTLGKHVGVQAFKEVVEHQGLDALADRLTRASKRQG